MSQISEPGKIAKKQLTSHAECTRKLDLLKGIVKASVSANTCSYHFHTSC